MYCIKKIKKKTVHSNEATAKCREEKLHLVLQFKPPLENQPPSVFHNATVGFMFHLSS